MINGLEELKLARNQQTEYKPRDTNARKEAGNLGKGKRKAEIRIGIVISFRGKQERSISERKIGGNPAMRKAAEQVAYQILLLLGNVGDVEERRKAER